MNKTNWISTIRSGGSLVCGVALKMFDICTFRHRCDHNSLNEILLYGAENEEHMQQIGLSNLLCIYYMILHAQKCVDVCVPSFASSVLAKCLINVHQKNKVKVRITIHNSDNFHNLQLFAHNGIEVKIIKPLVRLEHEFLLIDAYEESKEGIAVIGSLDYDTTRLNCNRDTTVLTSEIIVVTTLKKEFERVWNCAADVRFPRADIN